MKKNYLIGTISIVLVLVMIGYAFYKSNDKKEYSRDYFYMDTYINVKVYTSDKGRAQVALDQVDKIYQLYHNLTNRYESYPLGLYDLNHGSKNIDNKLYDMIKYANSWYDKTNGLLDISIGNVVDIWKKYRESGTGVPSLNELKSVNINHKDITINELKDNNGQTDSIKLNNNVQIDLGAISKGYTTQIVGDYLKSQGINSFIINAGGNVLVGNKGSNKKYKVGLEDPTDQSKVYKVLNVNDMAVVTSGGYQRNYTYNGVTYNHIINPNTLFPANNMKSVSVIDKDSGEADALSTSLFLMTIDEGKEFIKNYNADAIWYANDGTIVTTDGVRNYE